MRFAYNFLRRHGVGANKQNKKRNTTMKRMLKGFTLIEIMIVVAIIAILAAVAIPNFVKYRNESQRASCISNMKQLQTAGEQWLMSHPGTTAPTTADLCGSTLYIKKTPVCPKSSAAYTITLENDAIGVTCANAGEPDLHVLPESVATGN